MTVLTGLFLCRVLGQFLVSRRQVRFLPPMEQWQSGLLPYPVLLLSQMLILAIQATINAQCRRGQGLFVTPRPWARSAIQLFSVGYFSAMVARYAISMKRHPERRWLGKTIPIMFHCVLATYLFLYSRLLRAR